MRTLSDLRPFPDDGKRRTDIVGVTLLMKAVNVNKAVIGIENNKPERNRPPDEAGSRLSRNRDHAAEGAISARG